VELITLNFSDDLGQATQISSEALRFMAQNQIPATPQNYCVWYGYATGSDPELKKMIDILLSNSQEFTEEKNSEIFERFFGHVQEGVAIQDTGTRMSLAVRRVDELVQQVTKNTESYGNTIAENANTLETSGDTGAVVQILAEETKKMLDRNHELQTRLESSSEQIARLKQDLESVQREALTDGLTGIANRKRFDVTLRKEAMNSMEDGEPLCLILGDIDHFKRFNDTYGHQTGDQVLKFVAAMLSDTATARDLPARYGGEEFAVILPGTDIETAIGVAETIRSSVSRKRLRKKQDGSDIGNITLSLGVSLYRPGEPLNGFIKRADNGLYQAKHLGRDQVVSENDLNMAAA
jgi:diguanylate cyclase